MTGLLVFAIDDRRYGLAADQIVEMTRAVAITSRPNGDKTHLLEGVVNYHGELAAAINLRSRFGHEAKRLCPSEHFIFTRSVDGHLLALRADSICDIAPMPAQGLDDIPPTSGGKAKSAASANVSGVCKLDDNLVFIFDLKTFLSASESRSIAQHLAEATRKGEAGR